MMGTQPEGSLNDEIRGDCAERVCQLRREVWLGVPMGVTGADNNVSTLPSSSYDHVI